MGSVSEVPLTIEKVIISRFDRLTPPQQLVLQFASVMGFRFSTEPLLLLSPTSPKGGETEIILKELEEKGFITPVPTSIKDGKTMKYSFSHLATQEAIYSSVAFSNRIPWHRKIAEYYEGRSGPKNNALLAWHFKQGKSPERALHYFCQGAEEALRSHALREAIVLMDEVIRLLPSLEQLLAGNDEDEIEKYLYWRRRRQESFHFLGESEKAREEWSLALKINPSLDKFLSFSEGEEEGILARVKEQLVALLIFKKYRRRLPHYYFQLAFMLRQMMFAQLKKNWKEGVLYATKGLVLSLLAKHPDEEDLEMSLFLYSLVSSFHFPLLHSLFEKEQAEIIAGSGSRLLWIVGRANTLFTELRSPIRL